MPARSRWAGVRRTAALASVSAAVALLVLGAEASLPRNAAAAVAPATIRTHPMILTSVSSGRFGLPMVNAAITSQNWSGHAVTGNSGAFTSVSGCWTVPAVSGPNGSYSAAWIGVDGYSNSDLIQTGTLQDYTGGSAHYSAWWEILPAASTTISMTVSPGNAMCATISHLSGSDWEIALDNNSTGDDFSTTKTYSGPGDSAEWIVEAPTVDGTQAELADYGTATFTSCADDGSGADLAGGEAITMDDPNGGAFSTPSSPSGESFTLTYSASEPTSTPTATPTPTSTPTPTPTPIGSPSPSPTPSPSGGSPPADTVYTPLTPFRVCDTRRGNGTPCSGSSIGPGGSLSVEVAGNTGPEGQSVPASATSVVLNVTAIQGSVGTFLTVYPAGSRLPTASNLNVNAGSIQANLVVAPLGTGGRVSIHNSQGTIDVTVDVQGYFGAPSGTSASPGLFHPIAPLRICDTRSGGGTTCSGTSLGAGQWTRVVVAGCPSSNPSCAASVPGDGTAEAVALNLTAVQGTLGTYLSVVPPSAAGACPSGPAAFSNVNVGAGDILPNRVIVPLGPTASAGPAQAICVDNSVGTINFILDVNGWFGSGSESSQGLYYEAIPPVRICDTRSEASAGYLTECSGQTLFGGDTLTVTVDGVDGIPGAGAADPPQAVIANVTAVRGAVGTFFTLYPAGTGLPNASDLNVGPSQITPNLVVVQLASAGPDVGDVDLFNDLGTIDAIVDVEGWFQV